MAQHKYIVVSPIKVGGRRYEPDETVELDDKIAESVAGSVKLATPAKAKAAPEQK